MCAKNIAVKEKRAPLPDFNRFKLRRARSQRDKIRTVAYYNLRKAVSRDGTLYGKKKMAQGGDIPKPKEGAEKTTIKAPKPKK
ncbi:hypothetical protein WA026_019932 [Henosepilachna vigintioctopunctata]|uniref:Uncharacterized protein n=1 Tax=Henosepilachna vigintioctopunctata TaxID=420089 RepID=A0AAW1V0X6_9CUCU